LHFPVFFPFCSYFYLNACVTLYLLFNCKHVVIYPNNHYSIFVNFISHLTIHPSSSTSYLMQWTPPQSSDIQSILILTSNKNCSC
jgi:hypothetical protein